MARKAVLKVGDRVLLKEIPEVIGVIVFKQSDTDLYGNPTDAVWSVHWHNPVTNTKRRDMRSGRGIYAYDDLIKDKPKKKEEKKNV